jgi:hypothetical protein
MLPYDTYRLYQIERAKSPAEIRRAHEQAARLASAASSLFRSIMRPWRAMRRPPLVSRLAGGGQHMAAMPADISTPATPRNCAWALDGSYRAGREDGRSWTPVFICR